MNTNKKGPGAGGVFRWVSTLVFVICLGLLATVPLPWKQQAVMGLVLFAAAVYVKNRIPGDRGKLLMIILSLFCTSRYAHWRFTETYGHLRVTWAETHWLDLFFVTLLLAAESYAVVVLFLGYFQSVHLLRRRPIPLPRDAALWPTVDVLIPTYNEPLEVIKPTVFAALNLDWPAGKLRVYILDDGRRAEVHTFASAAGAGYITRLDNRHAKAGNINNALAQTSGDFVAVFDSDHVATRSFLQVAMGWFLKDQRMAIVQTPHHFYSADPFERNLGTFRKIPPEGQLFYGVIQDGNDFWNASTFCGSCAVLRRSALDEIGGIAVETVTEDAHTALRLHRHGWNSAYLNVVQAAGLATDSLGDHIRQRIRWARGLVQMLRIENPLFVRGLKLPQRLCCFNSVIHFLYATPRLIFLSAPLIYLLFGRSNVYGYVWAIMAYVIPHMALAILTNARIQEGHRHAFWNEVYETLLAPYILVPTLLALVNPSWGKFNVTPKTTRMGRSYFDVRIAMPCLILLALNLASVATGIVRMRTQPDAAGTLIVNLFWAGLNVLILGATLATAWERRERRRVARVDVRLGLILIDDDGAVEGVTNDISTGGASIQLNDPCHLRAGAPAEVMLSTGDCQYVLPITVVENHGLRMRFRFALTSLEQEEAVTKVIFSRADAWLSWPENQVQDRPLHSLLRLLLLSIQAIVMAPKGIVAWVFNRRKVRPVRSRAAAAISAMLILVALLVAISLRAGAAEKPPSPAGSEPRRTSFVNTLDLQALGQTESLMLRGAESRSSLFFAIPITKVIGSAVLHLKFDASNNFRPDASSLAVLLNGSVVVKISLGTAPSVEQNLDLPPDLLVSDNTLAFQVTGACKSDCTPAGKAALYVHVDSSTNLSLSGSLLTLADDLRLLPAPFYDRSMSRGLKLPVVFASKPDADMLSAAAVVASWFGVLADDRPVRFHVAGASEKPTGNVVLIGPRITEFAGTGPVIGPMAFLRENPNDPFGKTLVITGTNSHETLRAAQALVSGMLRHQREEGAATPVLHVAPSFVLPAPRRPYDAPRWLKPDQDTGLTGNMSPDQLRVYGSGMVKLYFRLPPDLFFGSRNTIPFRLDFRTANYAQRKPLAIRVHLNDTLVTSRRIEDNGAAGMHHETVHLPVATLYPNNELSVEFLFEQRPAGAGDQERDSPEAMVLPGSKLDLRDVSRFVRLPRMDLFAAAGFPFTRMADLSETAVVLPKEPSAQEIETLLNLAAQICGKSGYPAFRISVLDPDGIEAAADKDILILGTAADQPLFHRWARYLPITTPDKLTYSPAWSGVQLWLPWTLLAAEKRQFDDLVASGSRVDAVAAGFESPLTPRRSVVAIAVANSQDAEAPMTLMSGAGHPEDIFGSVMTLQGGRVYGFHLTSELYRIGNLGWLESFYDWMAGYFWLIPLLVMFLGVILANRGSRWAERRAELRLRLEV